MSHYYAIMKCITHDGHDYADAIVDKIRRLIASIIFCFVISRLLFRHYFSLRD